MEKKGFSSDKQPLAPRLSLAEEQQRAFEEDQRRLKRSPHSRWPDFLFRN
ncbi:hypothetical protein [Sphingomonas sp. LHG3443-2]